MTKDLKYFLAFSKIESVGKSRQQDIYKHFGSFKNAWNAAISDWLDLVKLPKSITTFEEKKSKIEIDTLEDEIRAKNIDIITIENDRYPSILKEIYNPPFILFIKGNLDNSALNRAFAVVGSRKCSFYAVDAIKKIIGEMTGSNITIISGGAMGIDTASHRAALDAGLKTIAVLGSGFDKIYPKQNIKLFDEIINKNGALISEYHPEKEPIAFRFPERNRIISGLSKGTLVAEAGLKSGALITAKLCLDHNRELMCLPGNLSNPNTEGTHKLLKEGAGLVTNSEDVFNYLNWTYDLEKNNKDVNNFELSEEEAEIYDIVSLEPLPIDKIVMRSNLTIGNIMVILTSLELYGLIKQLPGEKYAKA